MTIRTPRALLAALASAALVALAYAPAASAQGMKNDAGSMSKPDASKNSMSKGGMSQKDTNKNNMAPAAAKTGGMQKDGMKPGGAMSSGKK
ncbi:MAG TPA: hypothetical protein VNQ56_15335 [Pseudolabrys sp.]|nr:hypothetical protein [Pseudolabrys sp.]